MRLADLGLRFGGGFGRAGWLDVVPSRGYAIGLPSQAAGPTFTGTRLPSSSNPSCPPVPHDAPELEQLIPAKIAGKSLTNLVRPRRKLDHLLQQRDRGGHRCLRRGLAAQGLGLNDISVTTGGRSDTASDPPYFIHAYKMAGTGKFLAVDPCTRSPRGGWIP